MLVLVPGSGGHLLDMEVRKMLPTRGELDAEGLEPIPFGLGQAGQLLKERVDPATTTLCMDSHKSFQEMGKRLRVVTNMFVTTKAKPADFHVQNVNNCHERLKTWVDYKLRGVATKYLPSYLAWLRLRTCMPGPMSFGDLIGLALGRQIINC
jgi:hypothetical protein